MNSMLDEMQRMYVEQRDTKFTDTKIEKLNKAGALINESDELLKGGQILDRRDRGKVRGCLIPRLTKLCAGGTCLIACHACMSLAGPSLAKE